MNNSPHFTLGISSKEKYIEEMVNTEFLDVQIHKHLNWKNRMEQMIPKLSYAVGVMVHINNITTLNEFILHTFILL